ncbi:NAD-dependent epimerase/dehydratase family protein [Nocardioides sp. SR21]|uniref:NAD-dependent epimerase/dehydratase family protein n=1 Tax=Nocardioides sp. SR21 TaxID=2919501 RepID=UPI001FA994A2|nr:NAD-dependent epimerase/dehydratase family protein [Nocardioides sp. SR21]
MRVAITGASGNVGSALVRALRASGHDVVGVVRRPPPSGTPGWTGVAWVTADLATDCHARLVDAFRGADAVVHLVWGFQPTHDVEYLREVGVGGTRRVLAAAAAADVPHVVHQSSLGAYAPRRDLRAVDESWPTTGIAGSPYSRHKAEGERLVEEWARRHPDVVVSVTRPGIVAQRSAGSGQLRYFLPTVVPPAVLRVLPLLPLDNDVVIPVVHADDLAAAITAIIEKRAGGPFNIAVEALGADAIAEVLGARRVPVPPALVRAAAAVSWHLHLQPVDAGWVDMAHQAPVLDSTRARTELEWRPAYDGTAALAEAVAGMVETGHDATAVLRRRTIVDGLARAVREGPVARRRRP